MLLNIFLIDRFSELIKLEVKMISIKKFTFGPFYENTYLLFDETKECVIIDPGCQSAYEQKELSDFVTENELKPQHLLNTHCHVDHIMGNKFVATTYSLKLEANPEDGFLIENQTAIAEAYGFPVEQSPFIEKEIHENDVVKFGNSSLISIHVPGHSPGSIVFYSEGQGFMIVGDVLFAGSIGRSDLPGGNGEQLVTNIKSKLLVKPDNTMIYSGHGELTTIGKEKESNQFLR